MSTAFEELDHHATPLGELVLRRRALPGVVGDDVYEITLGGAFLMSSLVHESEHALARLALEARGEGAWSVLVGGLGLGYTAKAALDDARTRSLTVVELLPEVVGWHERGLLPLGRTLVDAPQCTLRCDDFYAMIGQKPRERWDLILVDIDHSPEAHLHAAHAHFYGVDGLRHLTRHLEPGGIFALWAGAAPDPEYLERLGGAFPEAWAQVVRFYNPHVDREDVNTVYLARL